MARRKIRVFYSIHRRRNTQAGRISVSNGWTTESNRRIRNGKERLPSPPPSPYRGELKLRPEVNTYVLLSAPQVQPRVKFSSCSSSKYTPSRFPRLSSSMHLGVVATPLSTPRNVKYSHRVKIFILSRLVPSLINESKLPPVGRTAFRLIE